MEMKIYFDNLNQDTQLLILHGIKEELTIANPELEEDGINQLAEERIERQFVFRIDI